VGRARGSRGELDSFEISDLVHGFHQGPSRDLFDRRRAVPWTHAVLLGTLWEVLIKTISAAPIAVPPDTPVTRIYKQL